ncbi:MAG: RNA polymerase sigma factor [Anaerolineales bacterium]|jgi:RNA polymerase sigma-70 factor (ECF subfamily)
MGWVVTFFAVKNESKLLQLARQFDQKSLVEIYDVYNPSIYRYAVRLLNNPDLAEECVAETFSRLLSALRENRGPKTNLRAYLYRIAHNWITDQYRKQIPQQTVDEIAQQADPGLTTSRIVDEKIEREKVRRAIHWLTPDQRQVVSLKYFEGWSNAEIAKSINKSVGAVKSLQHRALQSLKEMLT